MPRLIYDNDASVTLPVRTLRVLMYVHVGPEVANRNPAWLSLGIDSSRPVTGETKQVVRFLSQKGKTVTDSGWHGKWRWLDENSLETYFRYCGTEESDVFIHCVWIRYSQYSGVWSQPWSPLMDPDDLVMSIRNVCSTDWVHVTSLPLDDYRCVIRLHPDSPEGPPMRPKPMQIYPGNIFQNLPLADQPSGSEQPPRSAATEWLEPWSVVPAAEDDVTEIS